LKHLTIIPTSQAGSPAGAAEKLGRFELRQRVGQGAQATVWMAYDPRLDREVAIKLMHSGADHDDVDRWLQEARLVSRLNHPHIVPVYEADVHENRPYLVFEFVPGRTLAQHLRARGKLPVRESVEMMMGVLDALQAAHGAGVVHRDLKPSNILVDGQGRARVMDFGIAGRIQDKQDQQVVGTPGYMSPEATHGDKPSPAMDLFGFGLVLAEMLSGEQLVAEKDPYRAIYRVAHEDLQLPASMPNDVDDKLRAILMRCLARDPSQRHADVAALRDDLNEWLRPTQDATPVAASNGTLEFLLRRMRHKSDFPAMSDSVARIQRVANSDKETVSSLSNEILKDVALTNKLLRLVNTARYSQAGGGSINTVSRAVALIGFAGIRNMALSLVLLEHMNDKAHATQLKEEFIRSLMSASLAGELFSDPREGEEAFLGAMFHNLGRLLAEFYFPEEAQKVRNLVKDAQKAWSSARRHTVAADNTAAVHVLGISYQDLGLGVARAWGLPDGLQQCMRRPSGEPPSRPCEKADRLRWAAVAAIDMTDAMLLPDESVEPALEAVTSRYARVLDTSASEIEKATARAQQRMLELTQAMNLHVPPGSPVWRLLETPLPHGEAKASQYHLAEHELQATITVDAEHLTITESGERFTPQEVAAMLAAGIQDITNTMVEDFQLNEVLRMILETMLRALGFRRIIFCLRDAKTNTLTGRFGLGKDVEAVAAKFKVALKPKDGKIDLFTAVCLKGADTLIADATVPAIGQRLPEWYTQTVNAPSFLLLPLVMKGAPFALIYADKSRPGGIDLNEKSLSLLRTLRNQAVMAFKQST
jgi:serine/threonine protein kinase